MNDRFKFRVWSKQSNSYIKEKMFYIDRFGGLFKYEKSKSTVYINADSPYIMCLCGDNYIIEQCTGLKDKNGNLIYEGDIVVDEFGEKMLVCWDSEYLQFCFQQDNGWYVRTNSEIEVIGNIHENKDLLENEDD